MNNTHTFADRALSFYCDLEMDINVPPEIKVINPYQKKETKHFLESFLKKFFDDINQRILVLGINPGRFGSGQTGVPFTDFEDLRNVCGIDNTVEHKKELSSSFINMFISESGGAVEFYKKFYLSSVCPVGFTYQGKNLNFYENKEVYNVVESLIIKSVNSQINFGCSRDVAIIIGSGKNYSLFKEMNQEYSFFSQLIPIEHPRYVMQYQRKLLKQYILKYFRAFNKARSLAMN